MRVELLKTLKGPSQLWIRGTVLDDAVAPFPRDVQDEIRAKSNVVRVLPEIPMIRKEAAPEKPVAAAPETEPLQPIEFSQSNTFPELERLIHIYGSIAKVAKLFDVTSMTISRWRQKTPRPEMVDRIRQTLDKALNDDRGGTYDTASAGIEGAYFESR